MTRSDLLAAAALVGFWSSGFVGAELGTRYAAADTLLAWRYLVAAAVLLVVVGAAGRWPGARTWRHEGPVGLLTQAGYLGGVVSGVAAGVPAGTTALIAALQPLVVAASAGPVLGERTSARQWWALVGGLGGVALVVAGDAGGGTAPGWAYLLPVGAMLSLAAGTLLSRRDRTPSSLLESLTVHSVVAMVAFVAAAAGRSALAPPTSAGFWWSVAWVVVLSGFGGYGAYLLVLRRSGAVRVSAVLYLTPPTTMVWAYLMFGDAVPLVGLLGLAVCAVSVTVVLGSGRGAARVQPTSG